MTQAVNAICPWSGKPVSQDSLTLYREQKVGFCNPGCRDKFDAATHQFDNDIAAQDPFPPAKQVELTPYVSRYVKSLGLWRVGDMQLKLTGISASVGEAIPQSLITAAEKFTAEILPSKRRLEGVDHKVGYVILHQGNMGAWLLIHWWAHGDIQLGTLGMALPGTKKFNLQTDRHIHACVWEQTVIMHERNAWIEHMMNGGGQTEAYLASRLEDGLY